MNGLRLALIIIVFIILSLLGWYWYGSHDNDPNDTVVDDTIIENEGDDRLSDPLNDDIVNSDNGNDLINGSNNDDLLNVSSPEGQLSITPTSMGFSYDHNNPICPSPIGTVQFSGAPPDSTWQIDFVDEEQPVWFDVPSGLSGPINDPPSFEFPCVLDIYDSQSQFLDVTVKVLDSNSTLLGKQVINISGYFEFNGTNSID